MSAPELRHRAVEIIERHLRDEDVYDAAGLARSTVARLEAAGLTVIETPAPTPKGTCDVHWLPLPCHGCIADAKAAPDEERR
jgi:hypothetical protein